MFHFTSSSTFSTLQLCTRVHLLRQSWSKGKYFVLGSRTGYCCVARKSNTNAIQKKLRRQISSLSSTGLPHDVGGTIIRNAVDLLDSHKEQKTFQEKPLLAWEQECYALFALLASKHILSTDQFRRTIEDLTPEQYATWSYFEKWSAATASLLMEHGILSHKDIQTALFGSERSTPSSSNGDSSALTPTFEKGQAVRVRTFDPTTAVAWRRPHIRTPGYVYGVNGVIERVCGIHPDPSFLAFGWEAPLVRLYRVRFRQCDIWPEQFVLPASEKNQEDNNEEQLKGTDVVEVEIYEHWLESTEESQGHSYQNVSLLDHTDDGQDCAPDGDNGSYHHHHHHSHDHDSGEESDGSHSHDSRSHVEERAVRLEGPPRPGQELHHALLQILLQKEIVTSDELRIMMERIDTAGKRLLGADLVVQAWLDEDFRDRLIQDAASAAMELNIQTSNPNAPTVLTVVPNTSKVHNLIVCTLCSCYPMPLLGLAPSWYKSRQYRSRAVREPRRVLMKDFGGIPEWYDLSNKQIRIHDSTADHRYMVLPERPKGTETWTPEQLLSIVTRDSMLGVSVPIP